MLRAAAGPLEGSRGTEMCREAAKRAARERMPLGGGIETAGADRWS